MTREDLIEGILKRHRERLYTDPKYARKAHIAGAITKGALAAGLGFTAHRAGKIEPGPIGLEREKLMLLKDNRGLLAFGSGAMGLSALSNVYGALKKDPRMKRPE